MIWFLWALAATFCAAFLAEANRFFKLDARALNAWRASIATVLLMGTIPWMDFPNKSAIEFYGVAILDGIIMGLGMIMMFKMAQEKSGRVSSMILPLSAVGAFVMWWLIVPELRHDLVEKPFHILGTLMSLLMVLIALQKVRANDNSWDSFVYLLPVGLAFGAIDSLTKFVMGPAQSMLPLSLSYTFLSALVCAGVAWMAAIPEPAGGREFKFTDRKLILGGVVCGFLTAGFFLFSVFALIYAPNPALPGAVLALTPLILFGLNWLRNQPDDASPVASAFLILGAAGLVLTNL
jgi:hypothetical protein